MTRDARPPFLLPDRTNMHAFSLLSATLLASSAVYALPATKPEQLVLNNAQAALNWGAGSLSKLGDDGMHAMTRWDWNDCGEFSPACLCSNLWRC